MTTTVTDTDTCAAAIDGPPLPYWQGKRCPPWCRMTHSDMADLGDRVHQDGAAILTLTMEEPLVEREPELIVQPSELEVYTVQGYREEEPHLLLCHDEQSGVQLTLAEARQLAGILMNAVRQADGDTGPR